MNENMNHKLLAVLCIINFQNSIGALSPYQLTIWQVSLVASSTVLLLRDCLTIISCKIAWTWNSSKGKSTATELEQSMLRAGHRGKGFIVKCARGILLR